MLNLKKINLLSVLVAPLLVGTFLTAQAYASTQNNSGSKSEKNTVTLKTYLRKLSSHTGIVFYYSDNIVKPERTISKTIQNQNWKDELTEILNYFNLAWSYADERKMSLVIIRSVDNTNKIPIDTIKKIKISGTITSEDGTPLIGASISIKNTSIGTLSDIFGKFELPEIAEKSTAIVSSIGYQKQEYILNNSQKLVIQLKRLQIGLDETLIVGYGSTTKRKNTGSVSKISNQIISNQPVSNPLLALQGRVTGLAITQTSGLPGATPTVRLRGRNSISNGNDPLYIVDGVPFSPSSLSGTRALVGAVQLSPFNTINPGDIESIEVLKDADATAIYGSRGANGVILISTKKGKSETNLLEFNHYSGIGIVDTRMELLNSSNYIRMRKEALQNDGITNIPTTEYDINGVWDTLSSTNWQDIMIGNTAKMQNSQIALSAASSNTKVRLSFNYNKETSVLPKEFPNQKYSSNINISSFSKDKKTQVNFSTIFLRENSDLPTIDPSAYINYAPTTPKLYDSTGNLNWQNDTWTNPLASLNATVSSISTNINSNLTLSRRIISNLNLICSLGFNNLSSNQNARRPITVYSPLYWGYSSLRSNTSTIANSKSWIIEPQINYQRKFGKFHTNLVLGSTIQEQVRSSMSQHATDFSNDLLINNKSAAVSTQTLEDTYTIYHYIAAFGRLTANFDDRYIVNITGRRDGSSRFGAGNRYGNFGAIGAAWIITGEKFLKNSITFLSYAKLRGSIGKTGNDQMPDYQYLSTYTPYSSAYYGIIGNYPTRLSNPNYHWEEVKKVEFGLESSFFNDQLLFSTNYYRNRSDNQLLGYPLPSITGFQTIQGNLPATIQNEGTEFELQTNLFKNKLIKWSSSLNISIPTNTLIAFPNLEKTSFANSYVVGRSLFISKKFKSTGVDPTSGIYSYEDLDKDGTLSFPQDLQANKSIEQKYFGGFSNTISFNGFEADIFLQFVKQTGFDYRYYFTTPGTFNANQPSLIKEKWTKDNSASKIQKLTSSVTSAAGIAYSNLVNYGDNTIVNTSYMRLKNLSFSYTFSKNSLARLKITALKLYLQGQNLITFTDYIGLDPESGALRLPPIKTFTAGAQLSL
ncbi:SusC/RagA family TonB-linked outer membrane protein [uncultured Chitinophaga sp.]|uniref:SusC/RagA family TonB-linked outer membrane protein n=1 Tax=uncultured Chitinophaga sp. TaxID=339340 RepID=UPI0025DF4F73|nr:SusC/RagA family TonB-linked outer membrane protein [uncultured Chitinophaga sp.]